MNKKIAFIAIAFMWLIFFGGFIAYKEYTLRTGEKILLKTIPIDPRDLFRGDYVILSYEISSINIGDNPMGNDLFKEGSTVYVNLKIENGYGVLTGSLLKDVPKDSFFIKGKVKSVNGGSRVVQYGIESFFVPEGEGKYLEKYRNSNKLDVEIAVDKYGNAVINDLYIDGEVWIAP